MMKLKITLPGIGQIEIDGEEEASIISQAAFWTELPATCPLCGAGIRLSHRRPKGFTYYGLVCKGTPEHECNFGQKREDSSLYYKGAGSWRLSPGSAYDEDFSEEPPADTTITGDQIKSVRAMCREQGLIADKAAGKMFEGLTLELLSKEQADALILALETRGKRKG